MEFNKAYNREEYLSFLRVNFLPDDFQQEISNVENPVQFQYTQQVTRLGECESLGLVVYEVRHNSKHDARVGLTKEAFRLLADEFCERALVFFVPEDDDSNYRFSLIEITLDQSEESSRISHRYSNPHRYSYYLGKGIAYYTPNKYLNEYGRVVSLEDLRNRFSVEVLTKAFYQELSDWYAWAIMVVRFPNDLTTLEDNQKYNSEAMIRLITRLIFVWFLKQRHLVPDEFFDEQYIASELIEGFTPHDIVNLFGKSYDSKYYKGILQNLFFAMLNSPITPEGKDTISERRFRNGRGDYDNNKLMRHEDLFINPDKFVELANKYVPFLNGGLFDCLDDKDKGIYIDAFTDRKAISDQLVIPDFLFFGDEVGKNIDLSDWYGDKKKKKVSARGIIDILKRYNFTVEENTPFDQEVSLDPELLGKVFENLLAAYNPETQTTARKQTGSFYTPREIVQYMVDESLVAHLKRTVGEDLEPEYRKLIQYTDEGPTLTDDQKRQIMQSLYDCKVLDPACGSGAFPMGMLQQMVHILGQLDPNNEQWKDMMLNNAISETSEAYHNATDEERAEIVADIERSFNESINRPDYARKLYLIENCIYGVDIQPIAIQISKLRFFISLVVDQKTNNNPVDNFGIRPLPNLEAKFVAANTLIGLEKKDITLFDSKEIKIKEAEMILAKHKIFGAKTVKTKRKYKERVSSLRVEIANMLKADGAVGNKEALQLSSWDMFDQNISSSFFDPEWMFDVRDKFDIIIANPPYIGSKGNEEIFHKVQATSWGEKYFERWMDYFYFFIHKGLDLICDKGVLCFITTNYYYTATGALKLRTRIKKNHIYKIIDFGETKLFESALGQHNAITMLQKDICEKATIIIKFNSRGFKTNSEIAKMLRSDSDETEVYCKKKQELFSDNDNHIIISSCEINNNGGTLEDKISAHSTPLSSYAFITMGIVTLSDVVSNKHLEKFRIDGAKKGDGIYVLSDKELRSLNLTKEESSYIKPFYKNSDIQKYYTKHETNRWLIYVKDEGVPIHLPESLKQHFERFKPIITALKENFLKNEIAASVVKKWLKNGNYFVLFTPKKEIYFTSRKIVAPYRSKENIFSISESSFFASKDVAYLIPFNETFIYVLLGILNSKLVLYWLKTMGKRKGDILELYAKPLNEIPIKIPKDIQNFETVVKNIIENKKEAPQADTSSLENEIDKKVYRLYGLTYDEVLIVDPETPITREEYETA